MGIEKRILTNFVTNFMNQIRNHALTWQCLIIAKRSQQYHNYLWYILQKFASSLNLNPPISWSARLQVLPLLGTVDTVVNFPLESEDEPCEL